MRLKFWKKQSAAPTEPPTVREETPEPETPAPTATTRDRLNDPEFSARLLMANPSLFLELERGERHELERRREHREHREPEIERYGDNGTKPTTPLHAHEITPEDAAMINMMAGAHFGDDAKITLPSGRTITGAEMRRWAN